MSSTPQISIIMPAFNAARYLEQSVASVRSQTYTYWSLWIVDDGSTDETAEIAARLAKEDSRIHLLQQANGGQASARNLALFTTTDEWIAFLDADDIWASKKLEIQLHAQKQSSADIIFCGGKIFQSTPTVTDENYPTIVGIWNGASLMEQLFARNPIQNSSVLVKRELIAKLGGLNTERKLQNAEDYELWLRLAEHDATFHGLPDSLAHYRRHSNSSTAVSVHLHCPEIQVLERHWQLCHIAYPIAKKRLRANYRALAGGYATQKRYKEARTSIDTMASRWDRFGPLTLLQRLILHLCPALFIPLMRLIYGLGEVIKKAERALKRRA